MISMMFSRFFWSSFFLQRVEEAAPVVVVLDDHESVPRQLPYARNQASLLSRDSIRDSFFSLSAFLSSIHFPRGGKFVLSSIISRISVSFVTSASRGTVALGDCTRDSNVYNLVTLSPGKILVGKGTNFRGGAELNLMHPWLSSFV